jgi:hypothetical protein
MALVPETKEQKAQAEMERCVAWVAKLPEAQRGYFCPHGTYWGFKGALRFMSTCCKPTA